MTELGADGGSRKRILADADRLFGAFKAVFSVGDGTNKENDWFIVWQAIPNMVCKPDDWTVPRHCDSTTARWEMICYRVSDDIEKSLL